MNPSSIPAVNIMNTSHRQSVARNVGYQSRLKSTPMAVVCVVDPQSDAYEGWKSVAEVGGARVHFVVSADEALRYSRTHQVDLWVVNVKLPGLSGCELCNMLKSRTPDRAVYMVADEYSAAAEQAAWAARATLFGCKPGHTTWLGEWLSSRTRPASPLVGLVTEQPANTLELATR